MKVPAPPGAGLYPLPGTSVHEINRVPDPSNDVIVGREDARQGDGSPPTSPLVRIWQSVSIFKIFRTDFWYITTSQARIVSIGEQDLGIVKGGGNTRQPHDQ